MRAGCQRVLLAGHRVHERLVDHEHASRPGERAQRRLRVQDAGGVGRVADDHEVGVVGDGGGVEGEAGAGVEQHVLGRMAGEGEGDVRLGELRMHHDRSRPVAGPGDERERLGRAGGGEHLGRVAAVPPGQRSLGLAGIRVAADVVEARPQRRVQPLRPRPVVHVDREVDQPLVELGVPVMAERVGRRFDGLDDRVLTRCQRPTELVDMAGSNACTAAAKRRAISGWPAQWVCR